jgi:hypothetical protein
MKTLKVIEHGVRQQALQPLVLVFQSSSEAAAP